MTPDNFEDYKASSDVSDPVILTELSDSGVPIEKIRDISSVPPFSGNVKSYAGYLRVNGTHNSNLFFWFFPSEQNPSDDPFVLWLQGGPGDTFFWTLFNGNGPYAIIDEEPVLSNTSWTKQHNILFIDNPVGAGYSFTNSSEGYSKTADEAAANLLKALRQFFIIYSEYKNNDFFIAGESYAGKYIPALVAAIHEHNKKQYSIPINLKGVSIGCGFMDPVNQLHYANYAYELGIIDGVTKDKLLAFESTIQDDIKSGRTYRAELRLAYLLYQSRQLGYWPPIDVVNENMDTIIFDKIKSFIISKHFRETANVGSTTFRGKGHVLWNFKDDFLNSISHHLSLTLKNYRVLLYGGQFDMLIPPIQIDRVIGSLNYTNVAEFFNARRDVWYVNNELAGYSKEYGNLKHVIVRNAGHFILRTQPVWIRELFTTFARAHRN